jgi:predicted ATPase
MFERVEALNYRCLRYIEQPLQRFHLLVGPNASGKSTLLDTVRFLGDLIQSNGLEAALQSRTPNWKDLVWLRQGNAFELAIEVKIPQSKRAELEDPAWNTLRYQVKIGQNSTDEPVGILSETLLFRREEQNTLLKKRTLFPELKQKPDTLQEAIGKPGKKTIVNKVYGGNDNFYDETGNGGDHTFKLGPQRSALANLPEDETKFPVAAWFKRMLVDGISFLHLDSGNMSRPSPPGKGVAFRPDGSNLPWVVRNLKEAQPDRFELWIKHLRTSLADIKTIETTVRPEDSHCYLRIYYENDLDVPSWGLSDGTLRMLALTILPYLPELQGTFLIEEPENGIHPRAVETVYESLSSIYNAQVLVATHSPILISVARLEEILCLARDATGATDLVSGPEHPGLRNWQHEIDLGTLFAAGVLG